MDYLTILEPPNWQAVGVSVLQSVALYLLILLGLKLAGRRMFAEMGAQDLVVLLLVADAANLGLTHNDGGFWSSFFSVIAIIGLGSVIEDIPMLRRLAEGKPVTLYANGTLNMKLMHRHHVEVKDLEETARLYGLADYTQFSRIVMESDGSLTGTVRGRVVARKRG